MITFITVKGNSVRCPNKNKVLLPYTLDQIHSLLDDIVVITDDLELKNISESFNVRVHLEEKNKQVCELKSIYDYIQNIDPSITEFILLQVTQPIRNENLILNLLNEELGDFDFITSYTKVSNRSIFLLNEDNSFKFDSYERKGSLCEEVKMIDGCIYKIKTSFLNQVINSGEINHTFWNKSKIKFIENESDIFLDVDTPKDLKLFKKLTNFS